MNEIMETEVSERNDQREGKILKSERTRKVHCTPYKEKF